MLSAIAAKLDFLGFSFSSAGVSTGLVQKKKNVSGIGSNQKQE
jgi:hypothetical protein